MFVTSGLLKYEVKCLCSRWQGWEREGCHSHQLFNSWFLINKFSTVMTSPGPAFQECTGSCHENVPAPKAVSSGLRSTDGLTVLARIEIVAILVHYQPSYNTAHTQWNPVTHCCLPMAVLLCIIASIRSLMEFISKCGNERKLLCFENRSFVTVC